MKTQFSLYALALASLLSFSGCAAKTSGALSDFMETGEAAAAMISSEAKQLLDG